MRAQGKVKPETGIMAIWPSVECLFSITPVRVSYYGYSLASTIFGPYGSHFAVVWAIDAGIGRT